MPKRINIDTEVLELYKAGIGTCEIGKRLNVSRIKVWRTLKENNIIPERITRPHKNFFNINFFKEYNELSCYWAGFILADGNIHTKRQALQITLAAKDEEHLLKFAKHIDYTGKLYYHEKTNSYKIWISGKWFAEDLAEKFGIVSNKTFKTTFPDIPKKYISAFIRGIFDGDGCITKNGNRDVVTFCGTYELMEYLENYFHNLEIISQTKTGHASITKCRSIFVITYSEENAFDVLDFLYGKSNIHLDRKYNKYKEIWTKYTS